MSQENTIPIFFAVDNSYVPILAVALKSIMENASKNNTYLIKVLYTNISEKNMAEIKKIKQSNFDIEFVNLNYYIDEVKDKLYTRDYYTKTTYFRLFIPNLYPQFDKALYLDADIVVLADIAELYNQEIGDNLVAAVPDEAVKNTPEFQTYVERVVGVTTYKNYFNAGILLMNLDELRKFKFQEKFLYLLETVKYTVAQDQDYLNRLCKGRVKILDAVWDKMPMPSENITDRELKIIHYNLSFKPWHNPTLYEDFFWKYAKQTDFIDEIKKIRENYTEEQRFQDMKTGENLIKLAQKEADCVGNDLDMKEESDTKKSEDRLKILKKIEELERKGEFDKDVEDDPPTIPLMPEEIDYLNEKLSSRVKTKVANRIGERFLDDIIKNKKLLIKEIKGIENLNSLESGAVITCNHFNPFDVFAIEKVFRESELRGRKTLYKVIREGNYTNFPGLYGFFFRNCDTLPLSSNGETMKEFMKASDTILKRGDLILIYPEQSLWWNYRKPKPLKQGAFRIAARNGVPVIPIFITMEDSNFIGEDGFAIQEYTINIGSAIYPNEKLSEKENTDSMKEKNTKYCKNVYEKFYKTPLTYTTEKDIVNA
ncbi:MAG: 1-acyl-sn-glycerol-3-phosphate acyltransferase [Clostridia bacterium]|nr:1-acyl-sn-glycerol-3-phosphate acyltransferase [Clostridia bacterium]